MKPQAPGRLSPRVNPEVVAMICTAGHVDHGKTRLVGLLTGCQTDRLKVERDRGLTIELGFAPCFLGGNLCVGIVDVPGHEKFVKNMVAGVSGIAMTLLVIAADDGIMPQTIEHFQIMELLGVRHGMVALTKTDLVTPEILKIRIREIGEFLKGTPLEGSPICPVSAETYEGYPEFYAALVKRIERLERRPSYGIFRMPVERAFRREGFGSVATGIPTDGQISVGDPVELVPGGNRGKIRGIERFLREAQTAGRGQCVALNVPDFSKKAPERGQVLCTPGYLRPAKFFHLHLKAVPGLEKPVQNAETVKFHTGTIEEVGKIYLLEDKRLGEHAAKFGTIALNRPVAAAVHDRFILRRASPAATVAGGEILALTEGERRPRRVKILAQLQNYREMFEGVDPHNSQGRDRKIAYCLRWERPMGAATADLSHGTLLEPSAVAESLKRLLPGDEVLALADDLFIHREAYAERLREVQNRIEKAAEAGTLSLSTSGLRGDGAWPASLWNKVLEEVKQQGWVRKRGDKYILRGAERDMSPEDRKLLEAIIATYRETGFQSPRPAELPDRLGADAARVEKLLRYLFNDVELILLSRNAVIHYDHYKKAQDIAVAALRGQGTLLASDFKKAIGATRKYAIALLEYLDAQRITIRIGNDRKLAKDYEKHLL